MVFGVADKDGAIGVDPDAVGAGEAGGEGTVAVGAVGVRLATEWLRRRLRWRSTGEKVAGRGSRPG